jgi:hypothetical protein
LHQAVSAASIYYSAQSAENLSNKKKEGQEIQNKNDKLDLLFISKCLLQTRLLELPQS